ncbi:MAG: LacI family transcriptional regulator [Bacteroidetes bacterium]|nr:MAG: LacI family transcriptional regulator [Bacteroidota bacterium]
MGLIPNLLHMNPRKPSGIKEIARLAKVSIGTVDRVLHNRKGVAASTRARVLRIIEQTGYTKNITASRLKLASTHRIRIAILIPEISEPWSYWRLQQNGIEKAAAELKELGVTVAYFYFDVNKPADFRKKWQKIRTADFQAVVTVPFLKKAVTQLLEEAEVHHVQVVFLDTERPLLGKACFIRQNSYDAGRVAGRLLYGLVGEQGHYLVVNLLRDAKIQINCQQREEGFRSFFKENAPHLLPQLHTLNHPLNTDELLAGVLEPFVKPERPLGIFVSSARAFMVAGALRHFPHSKTFLAGFDLNQQNIACLKKGEIHFIIHQKPEYQGYTAVKSIYNHLVHEEAPAVKVDIPIEIIVKENLPSYIHREWA